MYMFGKPYNGNIFKDIFYQTDIWMERRNRGMNHLIPLNRITF